MSGQDDEGEDYSWLPPPMNLLGALSKKEQTGVAVGAYIVLAVVMIIDIAQKERDHQPKTEDIKKVVRITEGTFQKSRMLDLRNPEDLKTFNSTLTHDLAGILDSSQTARYVSILDSVAINSIPLPGIHVSDAELDSLIENTIQKH